jgi:hypothetical protein
MRSVTCVALSALLASVPAVSGSAAEPSVEEKQNEKLVCKTKPKTGTRFPTKTCRTVEEWSEIAEASKRSAAEMADKPVIETRRDQ